MSLERVEIGLLETEGHCATTFSGPKRGMMSRIAEGRHANLLALVLALSSIVGEAGSPRPSSPIPSSAQALTAHPEDLPHPGGSSSRALLERTLEECEGITELDTTEGTAISFQYHGRPVQLDVDSNHQVRALTFDDIHVTFGLPVETRFIERVIYNLEGAVKNVRERAPKQKVTFISDDGIRFACTLTEDSGQMKQYVATAQDFLRITDEPTEEERTTWKEAARTLEHLRADLRVRLNAALKTEEQSEVRLREKHVWVKERRDAVLAFIDRFIQKHREHPYKRAEWEYQREKFQRETSSLWEACEKNPHTAGFGTFEQSLDALSTALKKWEKYWLTPREDFYFTEGQLLTALERTELRNAVTARLTAVKQELQRRTQEAPTGSTEERQWQQWLQELTKQWSERTQAYDKENDWENWNPNPLSTERFLSLMERLDSLLAAYEKELNIAPQEGHIAMTERFSKEHSNLQVHQKEETERRKSAAFRTLLEEHTGRRVLERWDPKYLRTFERTFDTSGTQVMEKYSAAHRESRRETTKDGTQRTFTMFYSRGGKMYQDELVPESGRWVLKSQTRFRADGTRMWVSDRDADCLNYFAEDGTILTRIEYEDGGSKITRLLFYDDAGNAFSTFDRERKEKHNLTAEAYVDLLAKKLTTPEKIAAFLDTFLQYTSDRDDEWQPAQETVERIVGGRMRGDCDDYAFLAKAILRKQGKNAHVLYLPKHAECFWIEKRTDGRYDAFSLGTYGLDRNGNRYGEQQNPQLDNGYATPLQALQSLMRKYRGDRDLGLEEGKDYVIDPQNIWIMPEPQAGNYEKVTVEHFLRDV